MKKSLIAIVLAAATLPLTFAASANPQAAPDQSTTTAKTKKHAKKHTKKAKAPKSIPAQK